MGKIKITQVRSVIRRPGNQKRTIEALGLRRIGMSNTLPNTPDVRGQIAKVPHLVRVEEVD